MMGGTALLLVGGFSALLGAQRRPGPAGARRRALLRWTGWLLLLLSTALAGAAAGWRGIMIWFGLVPLAAAGAMLLHRGERFR